MAGLTGRDGESTELDRLTAAVRTGESRVLMVRGEAGVGKTSLLEQLITRAAGFRVLRAAGVQSEMELAFAGVHQLVAPVLDGLDRLPGPQQDALRVAFGLGAGPAPDKFLVGLAVLGLLSEVAGDPPLLCVVDDVQWLDRESVRVLSFVARRLSADPIGLVFGGRDAGDDLAPLPQLTVTGLRDADARAVLDAALAMPVDERVRDLIVAETRGNPLALLELPRGLTPAELAGGFGLLGAMPLPARIEETFERRLGDLPAPTRRLLTLAAADPSGDPLLVWRAAGRWGIPSTAAAPAIEAGHAEFGARVRFRHPLVRSAAYRSAPLAERRQAHAALAWATDASLDPDRRAWHRAQAAAGPDEEVAADLDRLAGRAQGRGGLAAAAAFHDQAALLTPDPGRRAQRFLAAAHALREAGDLESALKAVAVAETGPPDPLRSAQLQRLRGLVAADRQLFTESVPLLMKAARMLTPLDLELARQTHLDAVLASVGAGDLGAPDGVRRAAEAAQAAPRLPGPPRLLDLMLDAHAAWPISGHAGAAPAMIRAIELLHELDTDAHGWLAIASERGPSAMALEVWDFESWRAFADREVRAARELGALIQLQGALNHLAGVRLLSGELSAAERLMDEYRMVAEVTGNRPDPYTTTILLAWRGRGQEASALIARESREAAASGSGRSSGSAEYARAVLNNGLGRHDAALEAASRAFRADHYGYGPQVLPELAEAAARTGDTASLRAALRWMAGRTMVTRTDWALGLDARIRALAADGDAAGSLYLESIERLGRTPIRTQLARSHLLHGEWLRRQGRRVDARHQLRTAHRMLDEMGLAGFAERARRELRATGESVRKRTAPAVRTDGLLTAQETEVARLARDGLSNPEIGARLFLSTRTVQYHLSKVFTKLGISSRGQLHRSLPGEPAGAFVR
ncbi:helix-turn-helix transcriptional regulator [Paractinoplanes maris]|uniref:helix-turn-helix transcriptional regulator n=1 Tax=Paractinoplanes maris TaxID=1734446 RepID=UPI00201FE26F|nr:LuxR family transcriptional regulator [Actinoplanes maris]